MTEEPLKHTWIAAGDTAPSRIVVIVRSTLDAAPPIQQTFDRLLPEIDAKFVERVIDAARAMAFPYGLCYHVELHCKYGDDATGYIEDRLLNVEWLLRYSATHDDSHQVRGQALVALAQLARSSVESR